MKDQQGNILDQGEFIRRKERERQQLATYDYKQKFNSLRDQTRLVFPVSLSLTPWLLALFNLHNSSTRSVGI
jgi:hypothetical protein